MPTRDQVKQWNLGALRTWAMLLTTKNSDCLTYLDKTKTHFSDVHGDWSGAAYDAAYNRVLEDHEQGRKLTVEVGDLATVLPQAVTTLESYRNALLGKVADAEHAALTVDNSWRVSGTSEEDVNSHQGLINTAYFALDNAVSEVVRQITEQADIIRSAGDLLGSGLDVSAAEDETGRLGQQDGKALADWTNTPESQRNPAVLDEIASKLPAQPLTEAELQTLANGGEVDSLPEEVQNYYREFYQSAGKDGVLALSEHLKEQEEAGNTVAAAQRDSLANGLAVISNEDIGTGRNADGKLVDAGSYQEVPADIRELIEARRSDDTWPGTEEHGPAWAKQRHHEQASQLADLFGETNPGYQPGTELGTQLYEKASDMVSYSDGGRGLTSISESQYDGTAAGFAEFAGRNDDAAYKIWSGEGMHEGYDAKETVRSLTGYDWSESDNGRGAATLIDRITEESQLPADDLRGIRGRQSLAELGTMLAPEDDDKVWDQSKESFANNPELATSVSKAMGANLDAVSTYGQANGFTQSEVLDGRVTLNAEEANRLLQLGSYSEEGRVNLTTAVEQHRIEELTRALGGDSGNVPNALAGSDAGTLSGRVDNAMWDALTDQDQKKGDEAENPQDALYKAKMLGASIAGQLADEGVGKIPGAETAAGLTGIEVGDTVEDKVQEWLGKPEYEYMERPSEAVLKAEATNSAHQAILNAAYEAGQLPPRLQTNDGPIDIDAVHGDKNLNQIFTQFLSSHGLHQYVTDYGQSYAIDLGQQGGS
ncbi:hypothetical protein OG563_18190 [Nocardia vinacea]|uniref:TPR repeat domain-containing protein n=1 Tax=Nocardia vinacea TaxID=96468 RepID=A0ABZ1Z317_9NOCA|nr:hypothetical protein [Nocardia vinacea]